MHKCDECLSLGGWTSSTSTSSSSGDGDGGQLVPWIKFWALLVASTRTVSIPIYPLPPSIHTHLYLNFILFLVFDMV